MTPGCKGPGAKDPWLPVLVEELTFRLISSALCWRSRTSSLLGPASLWSSGPVMDPPGPGHTQIWTVSGEIRHVKPPIL